MKLKKNYKLKQHFNASLTFLKPNISIQILYSWGETFQLQISITITNLTFLQQKVSKQLQI